MPISLTETLRFNINCTNLTSETFNINNNLVINTKKKENYVSMHFHQQISIGVMDINYNSQTKDEIVGTKFTQEVSTS